MSRLTEKFSNGQVAVAGCGNNCKYDFKYCDANENCPTLSEIYEKLAYYEDLEEENKITVNDNKCFDDITTDDIASLLVKLYAECRYHNGCDCDNYAKAVGVAIRMLTD